MEKANIYVWHGKNSEESGKVLASILGTDQVGTHPPKGFNGILLCYGAQPSEKFKWDERSPKAILNDPRAIRKFVDRGEMFAALDKAGFSVPKTVKLTSSVSFDKVCEMVGSTPSLGLSVFKSSGSNPRLIRNYMEYATALKDKMDYASHPDFMRQNRIRALVVDGVVVGSLTRDNLCSAEDFAKRVSAEVVKDLPDSGERVEAITAKLIKGGFVVPAPTVAYWRVFGALHPKMQEAAAKAAKVLGYTLCAVDMSFLGDEEHVAVMNVVSTPDIASHPALHAPLADGIKLWMKRSFRSAKELLAEISEKATEEEAEAIVAELRQAKAQTA